MKIYKLFHTNNKNIPNINAEHFSLDNNSILGINVEPETYRDFMNNHYNIFLNNNIQQHIMTNYKFMEIIRNKEKLDIDITNISVKQHEELICMKNECYLELLNDLNNKNVKSAFENLKELIEDGIEICRIECKLENIKNTEVLNIYDNGTVSFSSSFEDVLNYLNNNILIKFLVKGVGIN